VLPSTGRGLDRNLCWTRGVVRWASQSRVAVEEERRAVRSRFMKPLCYDREGVFWLLGAFSPFASWSSPRPRGTRRCPPSISRRLSRRFPVALNLAYLCIDAHGAASCTGSTFQENKRCNASSLKTAALRGGFNCCGAPTHPLSPIPNTANEQVLRESGGSDFRSKKFQKGFILSGGSP